MSGLPGPLKRLDAKQKALLIVAVLIIIVAVASIESRGGGLDLTNPGLTVPPIATSTTTTTSMPTTTLAPTTTTGPTSVGN